MNELFDLLCAEHGDGDVCDFDCIFDNGRLFCMNCSATMCPTCGHVCPRSNFGGGCDRHATCCPCTGEEAGAGLRNFKVRGMPTGGPTGIGFLARKWGVDKADVVATVMRRRKAV